jgi:hypothetical protein
MCEHRVSEAGKKVGALTSADGAQGGESGEKEEKEKEEEKEEEEKEKEVKEEKEEEEEKEKEEKEEKNGETKEEEEEETKGEVKDAARDANEVQLLSLFRHVVDNIWPSNQGQPRRFGHIAEVGIELLTPQVRTGLSEWLVLVARALARRLRERAAAAGGSGGGGGGAAGAASAAGTAGGGAGAAGGVTELVISCTHVEEVLSEVLPSADLGAQALSAGRRAVRKLERASAAAKVTETCDTSGTSAAGSAGSANGGGAIGEAGADGGKDGGTVGFQVGALRFMRAGLHLNIPSGVGGGNVPFNTPLVTAVEGGGAVYGAVRFVDDADVFWFGAMECVLEEAVELAEVKAAMRLLCTHCALTMHSLCTYYVCTHCAPTAHSLCTHYTLTAHQGEG